MSLSVILVMSLSRWSGLRHSTADMQLIVGCVNERSSSQLMNSEIWPFRNSGVPGSAALLKLHAMGRET